MQVIAFIASYGPWSWIVAGLVLLALELVVPGGFLVWMGIAGIVTGLMLFFQPISGPLQWLLFGSLSLIAIFVWVRWSRSRPPENDHPQLNERAESLVGQVVALQAPIEGGFGRVALGDSVWRVSGPDLPQGTRVRVTGSNGPVLRVVPADQVAPSTNA
ncbi:NfeD family protein [Devosia sp. 1566]|uniref:NfeD family protein n=1 Tax=Devosia sp. 1566 TaxID=2499144 RepID=UPI000FD9DE82|nr:NfeD family protein [Devosia sp. 1566]